MKNQFKLLTLITFSCLIIYSCQNNIGPINSPTYTQVELDDPNYRLDISELDSRPVECSNTGFKNDTLNLTDIDLEMQEGESIEDFLKRLGFTPTLCSGDCDPNTKTCTVIHIGSSARDDIHIVVNSDGEVVGVQIDDPDTDIKNVKFRLRATCDCI